MKVIKKWIQSFIKKYIVDDEPVTDVEVFNEHMKRWEEWQDKDTPVKTKKKKRGRPKKKK